MSPEKRESIFNRFSQEEVEISRKVGGLGLGLSIAKENAELIGGNITLQSEKGGGSTFFVTIPFKPVNENIATSGNLFAESNIEMQTEYKILIVEDEEINYLYLRTLLENKSDFRCSILHAKDGKEAVDMCKIVEGIDLVFMDLKMPVMNGFEATKQIKTFIPDLKIIAQTAYSTNEDKEKAIAAGCCDFISKPIEMDIIDKMISLYLEEG